MAGLRNPKQDRGRISLQVVAAGGSKKGGFLSTFARKLGVSVVGTAALTADDIAPALEALRRKLMERNVASEIADKCVYCA